MTTAAQDRPVSPTLSQLPPVPNSPTYSLASTANPLSNYNLPPPPPPRPAHAILTKADLEQSQQSYSDLIASAKAYRVALANLSAASSAFGSALEACARLKEARADAIGPAASAAALSTSFTAKASSCTADLLMGASGVHHLIANHHQILSETVYRNFEVPLLHDLDKWQRDVDDEEESYQRSAKAQSKEIRRLEKEGLKLHKQKRRDVGRFRAHLVQLTTKLDGLTTLHAEHSRSLLRDSQETSGRIVDASCSLVRAEVDIFESLARKGWSGGGLDELLEKGADLFAPDETSAHGSAGSGGEAGAKLFSILPPKSILADSASDSATRSGGHGRSDSMLGDVERYQSLAGVAASEGGGRGSDEDGLFSGFNRSRGVRPFSPQPIRRGTTDVTNLSAAAELFGTSDNENDPLDPDAENDDDSEDNEGRVEPKMPGVNSGLAHVNEDDESPWRDERGGSGSASDESSRDGDRGRSWMDVRDETR